MSVGYGRGHYGDEQLEPNKPRRWGKILLIAGIGAGAWYLWRRSRNRFVLEPQSQTPAVVAQGPAAIEPPQQTLALEPPNLEQIARSHGFSTIKDYEDSVVANARSLKKSGAQVELGTHLQHLKPRLG